MVAKELLLLFLFCGVGFTSAVLEERGQRSQCRKQTVFCPCKDRQGMTGHVLVVTCSDQIDPNIPLCQGKALYSEECGKVNFSSKQHRRDTGNCMNGIIPGSPHTSDKDPQALMISGSSITREVDGSSTFKCQVHSNFSANITWLFNGKPLEEKGKHSFASCKRNLLVKHISRSDAGNYTCVVTNKKGKQASAHAKLSVYVNFSSKRHRRDTGNCMNESIPGFPHTSAKDPQAQMSSGRAITRDVDDSYTFKCQVHSNFPANVTWLFNGKPLEENWKNSFASCKRNLQVKYILQSDAGNYTCVVTNDKGKQASAHAELSVIGRRPPAIEYAGLEPGDTPYIGTTVNITCRIRGFDPLVIGFFLKNGTPLHEDNEQLKYVYFHSKKSVTPTHRLVTLEIKNITMKDAGNYMCLVLQDDMNSSKTFLLKVGPCPAGFYCPPGRHGPIQCPQGSYQPNVSQTSEQACKPCPAGFYCPPKATGPVQCPMGTYQPDINQTSKYVCKQCTAGFYCPPGGSGPIQCPQGTYQPNISQTSEEACKRCPFFINSSKNLGRVRSILYEVDCPGEDPSKETTASTDVTKIVIGTAIGVVIIIVLAIPLLFIAKKKRLLWFSSLGHRHDPECYTCQPMLNGDTENAEGAEVLRMLPEIDYEAKHDVFICYCYKDVDWAKELLAELEKRGFKCCIDFKSFTVGETIVQNIAEAICFSKKTIAVLSPDFIKSGWCKDELHKALSRVRYHQVVPVMYKNCEIPFALRDTTYLDWENCNVKPFFWEQLEKALRKPNGKAYISRRLQNGNQTLQVSVRV